MRPYAKNTRGSIVNIALRSLRILVSQVVFYIFASAHIVEQWSITKPNVDIGFRHFPDWHPHAALSATPNDISSSGTNPVSICNRNLGISATNGDLEMSPYKVFGITEFIGSSSDIPILVNLSGFSVSKVNITDSKYDGEPKQLHASHPAHP
ncbi:MAG: hypothetical protein JNN07_12660 [Verrucomicrobiales bacterium]|nr:hypothetical protein [Verrucomicrobiales bacterium]